MQHARSSQINTSSKPQQSPISKFIHRSTTASSLTQMKSWAEVGTLSGGILQERGLAPYIETAEGRMKYVMLWLPYVQTT